MIPGIYNADVHSLSIRFFSELEWSFPYKAGFILVVEGTGFVFLTEKMRLKREEPPQGLNNFSALLPSSTEMLSSF